MHLLIKPQGTLTKYFLYLYKLEHEDAPDGLVSTLLASTKMSQLAHSPTPHTKCECSDVD